MKPLHHLDVDTGALASTDSGLSPLVLRSQAFAHLHHQFKQRPGTFALAIPTGTIGRLRVFAETPELITELARALERVRWFRDYARVLPPRPVPDSETSKLVGFCRYRIPTVRSDRHATDGVSTLRDRRLAEARRRALDHFNVRSASTASTFSLTVERVEASGLPFGGTPNSYGLGSRENLVGVPDFA